MKDKTTKELYELVLQALVELDTRGERIVTSHQANPAHIIGSHYILTKYVTEPWHMREPRSYSNG